MAKMKIHFGKTWIESWVEIDGKPVSAQSASLKVDTHGYSRVEVEQTVNDPKGRHFELVRKFIDEPVEIEVEVPDSVKERSEIQ